MSSSSCVVVGPSPSEIELTYQSSPFQVTLCDVDGENRQSLETGVRVTLSAQKSYWFKHLWGCEISAFHEEMRKDWKQMRQSVMDGTFLQGKSVDSSEAEMCFENETERLLKPGHPITPADLGQSPRSRFPLVIVMILNHEDGDPEPGPTDTVALICAIHVQDAVCTTDSSFVFKLSKLTNGQVLNVSNLFTRDAGHEAAICLICETRNVTIGLLPCRHFSICEVCYSLLEPPKRCPICRSYITRFFRHKMTADSLPAESDSDRCNDGAAPEVSQNWLSRTWRKMVRHQ
jgi:hypothetical protein